MAKVKNSTVSGVPSKLELFERYQAENNKVETLKKQLEDALILRSAAVKAISDNYGVGAFRWQGALLKIFKRESKDDTGNIVSTNYHFREIAQGIDDVG
jgi:hypothetical protein